MLQGRSSREAASDGASALDALVKSQKQALRALKSDELWPKTQNALRVF
jgi:hypothetical protein